MGKIKKLFTKWRIILLIACIVLSVLLISPTFSEGVAIRNVLQNSSAFSAGIPQPNPNIKPVDRETIISINNKPTTREAFEIVELNETELIKVTEIVEKNITINGTSVSINETIEKTIR